MYFHDNTVPIAKDQPLRVDMPWTDSGSSSHPVGTIGMARLAGLAPRVLKFLPIQFTEQ